MNRIPEIPNFGKPMTNEEFRTACYLLASCVRNLQARVAVLETITEDLE